MIFFIQRIDKNPGDFWSSPRHYFSFPRCALIDILDIDSLKKIPYGSKCIVGGGGLIKQIFAPSLHILKQKKCRIVFWGIGERLNQDLDNGWIAPIKKQAIHPEMFHHTLHLTSFRSLEPGIEWIPCASCNHPIFDKYNHTSSSSIKIFSHKKVPINNEQDFPLLINDPVSLDKCIKFISDAEILITNSYHGMYWSYLLGIPTICIPFSSGHYSFVEEVYYSKPDEIGNSIIHLQKMISTTNYDRRGLSDKRKMYHRIKSRNFYKKAINFLK